MESERLAREWDSICSQIKTYSGIDTSQINAFFSRLQPQAMSDGFLMLTADNDFIKTWVERHYLNYIVRALNDLYHIDYVVAIEVDINQQQAANRNVVNDTPQHKTDEQVTKSPVGEAVNTFSPADGAILSGFASTENQPESDKKPTVQPQTVIPDPASKQTINTHPTSRTIVDTDIKSDIQQTTVGAPTSTLSFENFVIGASNRMAYSMAVAVAEAPGMEQALNPLFIYGKSGLGKTHLLRAIQNYISVNLPHLRTVYADSAQLLDDYTQATIVHDYRSFKDHYEGADVLLIDDVQYLQGKKQTLEIVFQIFNNLTSQGKQVVLSADRAPKNIDIDERYSSRFNSGGTVDIQPPEFEVKLGIVKNFIDEYRNAGGITNLNISDEVMQYIAENSSSNIRELKSAVTKVIFHMNAFEASTISLEEVKDLLENHFSGGSMKKLTVADIQKQVESYYRVSHADLIGKKRSRNIVYARQIAIYLARHMLDLPYSSIGKSFGGKDHTTIMYSVTNIEEKMKENLEIREELESIRQMIREM